MRLLVLASLLLFTNGSVHNKEAQATQYETEQGQQYRIARSATEAFHVAIGKNEVSNQQGDPYDASKDCLYRLYLLFTIVGVIAAVGGVIAIYKQTMATQKSAAAAKSSADALQNIEHAWVFMESVKFPDQQTLAWRTEVTDHDMEQVLEAVGVIKNYGRTPAKVVYHRGEIQLGDSGVTPPNPSVYEHTDSVTVNPFFISPGGTHGFFHNTSPTRQVLTRVEIGRLKHVPPNWFLWFCGFFDYEDVFGRTYTLRYCYVLDWVAIPNGTLFNLAGPAQYNSHAEK